MIARKYELDTHSILIHFIGNDGKHVFFSHYKWKIQNNKQNSHSNFSSSNLNIKIANIACQTVNVNLMDHLKNLLIKNVASILSGVYPK